MSFVVNAVFLLDATDLGGRAISARAVEEVDAGGCVRIHGRGPTTRRTLGEVRGRLLEAGYGADLHHISEAQRVVEEDPDDSDLEWVTEQTSSTSLTVWFDPSQPAEMWRDVIRTRPPT